MKQRSGLLIIMIVIMLSTNTSTTLAGDNEKAGYSSQQYQAPIVEEIEMLPDPLLNDSQIVVVEGAPGNFDWTHVIAAEPGKHNNLSLTWNHTAGDSINFRSPGALDPDLPESYDFIYMKQTFAWSSNLMPDGCRINTEWFFSFQYDFDYHDDYFKYYLWLIDSSGDWIKLREGDNVYPFDFSYYGDILNVLQIKRAWEGMIQDENGIQDDPTDTLTLAIGLAPSLEFANHTDTLNGSITMTIREVSLLVYHDQLRDAVREPDVEGNVDTTSIIGLYGLDSAPDGSLYTVQSEGGYEQYNYDIVVQKWSSQCVPLWSRGLRGPDIHVARDFNVLDDGSVLVLGVETKAVEVSDQYPMLVRWNADGEMIWKHVLEDFQDYRLRHMAVASDGSIFVGGYYQNVTDDRDWAVLAKLSRDGTRVWSKTWSDNPFDPHTQVNQIITSVDGTVYARTSWGLSRFDDENRVLIYDYSMSVLYYQVSDVDSAGNLVGSYVDYHDDTGLGIFKMDRNGTMLWNSSWGRGWNPETYSPYEAIDLEIGVDGSIYIVGATWLDSKYYFHIVKWDKNGTVITSVVWTYDREAFAASIPIELTSSGTGYIYTVMHVWNDQRQMVQVAGFRIGPLGLSVVLDPTVRVIATIAVSSFGVAALMHLARKRGIIET